MTIVRTCHLHVDMAISLTTEERGQVTTLEQTVLYQRRDKAPVRRIISPHPPPRQRRQSRALHQC